MRESTMASEPLIGLEWEDWITHLQVARENNVTPNCVYRWMRKGRARPDGVIVNLKYLKAGRRVVTSRQAVLRYFRALTPPQAGTSQADASMRTPAQPEKAAERADRALEAAGIY